MKDYFTVAFMIIGIVMSAVAAILLVVGGSLLRDSARYVDECRTIKAEVTEVEPAQHDGECRCMEGAKKVKTVFRYVSPADGQQVVMSRPYEVRKGLKAGDEIDVLYHPDKPDRVYIDSVEELYVLPIVLLVFGVLSGFAGVVFLVLYFFDAARVERIRKRCAEGA